MTDPVSFVQSQFRQLADPVKAPEMAAYMKTDMPFYGIQKPQREPVYRQLNREFRAQSVKQYESTVLALWQLPHREEKYAAIEYAMRQRDFISEKRLPLYRRLVREGAWWDLVDPVAIHLIGIAYLGSRKPLQEQMDAWIESPDLWIRRTAIICQIKHKTETDERRLFGYCRARASETEFFIRKAIGWALREYSYTAPDAVCEFLLQNQEQLSGLSFREGAKLLRKKGYDL